MRKKGMDFMHLLNFFINIAISIAILIQLLLIYNSHCAELVSK